LFTELFEALEKIATVSTTDDIKKTQTFSNARLVGNICAVFRIGEMRGLDEMAM
jgi:hypothetical protein